MFDPISIGLMLAGSALGAINNSQALAKQKRIQVANQQELLRARNMATDVAMKKAMEFNPESRGERQDEIAQKLEAEYQPAVQGTPITAQGVQVGGTIPTAGASGDYLSAKARERVKSTESLRQLAQLMGRIGSAGQLRQNEAVGLGDAAGDISRIQNNAGNLSDIETIRTNAVTPSLGMQLASTALSEYGMGRMMSSGVGSGGQRPLRRVAPGGSYGSPDLMSLVDTPWN